MGPGGLFIFTYHVFASHLFPTRAVRTDWRLTMNNNDSSNDVLMGLGGVFLVVVVCVVLMKAATKALIVAGKFFDALGSSASAFAVMLFGIGKVIAIVAIVGAAIYYGVYMTYRYVKLVRRVCEIREEFFKLSETLRHDVDEACSSLNQDLWIEFKKIRAQMNLILNPPEPLPPPAPVMAVTPQLATSANKAVSDDSSPTDEVNDELIDYHDTHEDLDGKGAQSFEASNPY
jgi:hypothetical protein